MPYKSRMVPGSRWILGTSSGVRFLLDGRLAPDVRFLLDVSSRVVPVVRVRQVLVGSWLCCARCQVLVGSWPSRARRQVLAGCLEPSRSCRSGAPGSCWILDTSLGVGFLLGLEYFLWHQVLVGSWPSRARHQVLVGCAASHASSLSDLRYLARCQVLAGCLEPSRSCRYRCIRFLLDLGNLALCRVDIEYLLWHQALVRSRAHLTWRQALEMSWDCRVYWVRRSSRTTDLVVIRAARGGFGE